MISTPKGFKLSVYGAGFRKAGRPDLALACSEVPAAAAGVFTQAAFKAAPVLVGQESIASGEPMRAVLVNSGQANACTGEEGVANCRATREMIAREAGIDAACVLPASTGVIGDQLRMDLWEKSVGPLVAGLGKASVEEFARAIMTTDCFPKYSGRTVRLAGGEVTLAAAAKGAGMICPTMATMISVVLCDAAVDAGTWQDMFARAVDVTFNRVSVDGDTSTNDTVYGLANGASGVQAKGADLEILEEAVTEVLAELAYMLVQDGEGATKVLHIAVSGAADAGDAEKVARTVGHSQLVKTAMYGKDANWGRIVAAVGRSGARFNAEDVRVSLGGVELFANGRPNAPDFDALLKDTLESRDIYIEIVMGSGPGNYSFLASDLTHKYVDINAAYRS